MKLPAPRGPLGASLTDLLVHPPRDTDAVDDEVLTRWRDAATTTDLLVDEDVQLALYLCYELSYGGFDGVDDDWEWDPQLLGARRVMERGVEAVLRDRVAGPRASRRPGGRRRRPVRDDRAVAGAYRRAVRRPPARPEQAAGVPRPPVESTSCGGRPAHVGDPAPGRRAEGRPRGDPGGRVRRRPARPDARRAVRPHDARRGLDDDLRPLRRRGARRHAGRAQRHVAVRPAPAAARCDHRAPGRVRDDVVAAEPALRRRVAPARVRRGHAPTTSTSTSRPTPCTSRSPDGTWRGRLAEQEPELLDDILFGAAACLSSTTSWRRTCWARGRRGHVVAARAHEGR